MIMVHTGDATDGILSDMVSAAVNAGRAVLGGLQQRGVLEQVGGGNGPSSNGAGGGSQHTLTSTAGGSSIAAARVPFRAYSHNDPVVREQLSASTAAVATSSTVAKPAPTAVFGLKRAGAFKAKAHGVREQGKAVGNTKAGSTKGAKRTLPTYKGKYGHKGKRNTQCLLPATDDDDDDEDDHENDNNFGVERCK